MNKDSDDNPYLQKSWLPLAALKYLQFWEGGVLTRLPLFFFFSIKNLSFEIK